ncbi:transmembrane and immunoglobulin domain-containing protein 2 [Tamandua tetradactyla]|uniref:transmembrane and immunoglobulin domain-containing protein 2 n=1 Tax=Tamandua tetradactyla TaxID=48850 RepID=UPI00405472E1
MGFPGMALVLLVQFWALRAATGLSTRQEPESLRAGQGSQVTLSCRVTQAQAWERLRVSWTKDCEPLCHLLVTEGSLHSGLCGPRGRLSWRAPGHLTLRLESVGANDSGHYVCRVTMEIPELEEAHGNGTWLLVGAGDPRLDRTSAFPGLLLPLLVGGSVAVVAITLGAGIWGRRHCRRRNPDNSGNPVYGNVLHRPRGPPKKSEAWPGKKQLLDTPRKDKKDQSFYATSFPQSTSPLKPCPNPRPHPTPPLHAGSLPAQDPLDSQGREGPLRWKGGSKPLGDPMGTPLAIWRYGCFQGGKFPR